MKRYFITAIDTNAGKTVATGLLAKSMRAEGKHVITAKLVQTGCSQPISEDITEHRRLMGIELTEDDFSGITCPYVFKHPSSPHLSARLEGCSIDTTFIDRQFDKLGGKYNTLLIEGAGGIYVPLNDNETILSYIISRRLEVYVVSTARLGSINHTLLTVHTLLSHNVSIAGIIYNTHIHTDPIITEDTFRLLKRRFPSISFMTLDSTPRLC